MSSKERIYGMQIVPDKDKNGLAFGGFEGIVISRVGAFDPIEISKMINKDNGYFTETFIQVPYEELLKHMSSAKEEATFLYSKALDLVKANEEIAISNNLAIHIRIKAESDKELSKLKDMVIEEEKENDLNSMHGNTYILVNRVELVSLMAKLKFGNPRKDMMAKVYGRATKEEIKKREVIMDIPITVSEYKKIFSGLDKKLQWKKRK